MNKSNLGKLAIQKIVLSILLLQLIQSCSTITYEKDYDLIYEPNSEATERLKMGLKRNKKIPKPHLLEYNFSIRANNYPDDAMSGWYVEKWKEGQKEVQCIGGGTYSEINNHYKWIFKENLSNGEKDTSKNLGLYRYMANRYEITMGVGELMELNYNPKGFFKINKSKNIEFCHHEKFNVIAYLPAERIEEINRLGKEEKKRIEELPIEEFIEDYIKDNSGFVLFYYSTNRENFFKKMT